MSRIFSAEDARHRHSILGTAILTRLCEMGRTQLDLVNLLRGLGFDVNTRTVNCMLYGINANSRKAELQAICAHVGIEYKDEA